jgi:Zn-dependent protease
VFLLEPQHTQFDLHFRIFRIPVRVHPMFWLFSAFLGWGYIQLGLEYVLLWVACTFVSILVHELGHVLMGLAFGVPSHIVLYSFGGLAVGSNREPYRWQRVAVSFAGPLAGLLLFGAVWLFARHALPRIDPDGELEALDEVVAMLLFMNLAWSLLNLLPIWPLDGGQISREVFLGVTPRHGLRLSLGLSFVLAGLLALHCLLAANGRPLIPSLPLGGMYTALLFALLALESFQLLQQAQAPPGRWHYPDDDDDMPWGRRPS